MVNDHELLTELQRRLPADELPHIVGRLMRVPEAWAGLHDQAVLDRVLSAGSPRSLTPATMALIALGFDDMPVERLTEDMERELSACWMAAVEQAASPRTLKEVGLLAIGLRREAASQGATRIAGLVLAAPDAWSSALACAWPYLPESQAFLRALISNGTSAGLLLSVRSLMANQSVEASAEAIYAALGGTIQRSTLATIAEVEPELVVALATRAGQEVETVDAKSRLVAHDPDGILDRAAILAVQGSSSEAGACLQDAWDATHCEAAEIADAMAEIAEREGNRVVATEARRQSVHFHSTPERKALLAIALAQAGRPDEAMRILPPEGRSAEELVAAATASFEAGDLPSAQSALREAARAFAGGPEPPLSWLERLAAKLAQAGLNELALEALGKIVRRRPGDGFSRARYADALLAAADYERGAAEASAALLLDPGMTSARRVLATCLQNTGKAALALEHWRAVVEQDPSLLPTLGECALEAGDLETASNAAQSILQRDPASSDGRILGGEVLLQKGEDASARAQFEDATRADPTNARAWIALASAQAAAGDAFASGTTLTHAAQLLPQAPELWAALAAHYRGLGQARQALGAIERALQVTPSRADWLSLQGEMLNSLGHRERAVSVLREALSLRPGDSTARMTLARLCEEQGDIADAAELVQHLRNAVPAPDRLAAARILILQAESSGDHGSLALAEEHLRSVAAEPGFGPQVAFWSGRLHEAVGRPEAAFESYREAQSLIPVGDATLHRAVSLGLARAAIAIGQPALALATLEAALADHPTSVEIHLLLSQAALKANLGERALQAAQQAFDLDPHSASAALQLARVAAGLQQWEKAAAALRHVVALAPGDLDARFQLAGASLKAGDASTARGTLASILWEYRSRADVLQRAATHLGQIGESQAAGLAIRRAASLLPESSEQWRSLAAASEEIGDLETAQRAWCRISETNPKDVEALAHAARSMWKLGRRSAAIGLWQRCVALDPLDAGLHSELARAYLANGEAASGLNHYSHALRHSPSDPALAKEAGEAALGHGAIQEALDILRHAARLAPHDPQILTSLAEALYRAGRPQECLTVLAGAPIRDKLPAVAHALCALASVATGDSAAARTSLQEGLRTPPRTAEEALWLSRAALKLGEWAPAVNAFDRITEHKSLGGTPEERIARIAAAAQALEAHAVLQIADAREHLPEFEALVRRAEGDLRELASTPKAVSDEVEGLRLRISIAKGEQPPPGSGAGNDARQENLDGRLAASMAIDHIRNGRFVQALDLLRAMPPGTSEAWAPLLRGVALAAAGEPSQARQEFGLASGDPVFGPPSEYLSAVSWLGEGKTAEAIAGLNRALASWPGEPEWHHRLAGLYLETGNLSAALPHLQQATELDPRSPAYALALGRALRADGQISQAKDAFARVLDHYPTDGGVWKEAGELALATGEAEVAAGWLERACTLSPSDAHAVLAYAQAAHALGYAREAADRARAAARLAPEDPSILLGLGEMLARQGKLDKALEAYDQALEHAANPLPVQLARCRLLTRLGRADHAVAALEQLAAQEPESHQVWGALAEAREAAGEVEPAIEAATHAARLSPRSSAHHLALARLSRKTGQLDRALDEVHQAQVLAPGDAAIFIELGAIYEHRREVNQALQAYQKAISLDQNSSEAHFRAGLVLKALKSYSQAARMFRRAVDLDPKDPAAAHQLAAVRALELVHGGTLHTAVPT